MFQVKSRSAESWGPLAECKEDVFQKLLNSQNSKEAIKTHVKKQKKMKKYNVRYTKQWQSVDSFEIEAEDEYSLIAAARNFFNQNETSIGFKEKKRNKWADSYAGYDTLSYVKVN